MEITDLLKSSIVHLCVKAGLKKGVKLQICVTYLHFCLKSAISLSKKNEKPEERILIHGR